MSPLYWLCALSVLAVLCPHRSVCHAESISPLHIRDRYRRSLLSDIRKIRKRRTIEVPPKTGIEIKWSVNLPFETILNRFTNRIQVAVPVIIPVPAFLLDPYGVAALKGFQVEELEEKEEEEPYPKPPASTYYVHYPEAELMEGGPKEHGRRSQRSIIYGNGVQKERINLYSIVEGFLSKFGLPTRNCLLRTICEIAEQPITYGMAGDFINIFFTPSLVATKEYLPEYEEYVRAEYHGHQGHSCHERYNECPESMFELLPLVAKTFLSNEL